MRVARVAFFEAGVVVEGDDDERASSLRALVSQLQGFVAGYHLREESSGRLMSFSVWDSVEDLERAEVVVGRRPTKDQRGIEPELVERWLVEGTF